MAYLHLAASEWELLGQAAAPGEVRALTACTWRLQLRGYLPRALLPSCPIQVLRPRGIDWGQDEAGKVANRAPRGH